MNDPVIDVCDACGGTGTVDNLKCAWCKGSGFLSIEEPEEDSDYDPYDAICESRFGLPGGGKIL